VSNVVISGGDLNERGSAHSADGRVDQAG